MKSLKGLFLVLGMSLMAFTGIEANSTSNLLKDNIFTAIRSIDYTSINVLLSDGLDIDTVDQEGNTPLMIATNIGNPRIMDIILSHNPNIDQQNKKGMTALMIAAETGQLHAVKKLVGHGANIARMNNKGETAPMLASKFGHSKIVSYFKYMRLTRSYSK